MLNDLEGRRGQALSAWADREVPRRPMMLLSRHMKRRQTDVWSFNPHMTKIEGWGQMEFEEQPNTRRWIWQT